jgi:hypothetical protein
MNINEYEEALKEEKLEVYKSFLEDENNYRIIHDKVTAIANSYIEGWFNLGIVEHQLNNLCANGLIRRWEFGYKERSIVVTFHGNQKRFCLW